MVLYTKKGTETGASSLSYLDSNQDKLIQSQMCYRYTIGQSVENGCKSTNFFATGKTFF